MLNVTTVSDLLHKTLPCFRIYLIYDAVVSDSQAVDRSAPCNLAD
jgi:hypothetical protein